MDLTVALDTMLRGREHDVKVADLTGKVKAIYANQDHCEREEENGFQRTQAFTAQKSSLGFLTNLISAGL
jgi:hypothetical protein